MTTRSACDWLAMWGDWGNYDTGSHDISIVEGLSHGGRSVDWLRDKIFFGPDMMYLKCANPLVFT